MKRPFFRKPNKPSVLLNSAITFPEIRLIDPNGQFIGIVRNQEAQQKAKEAGLDLICMAPKANPPVCRIMEFGKWNYEKQKADKEFSSSFIEETRKIIQWIKNTRNATVE